VYVAEEGYMHNPYVEDRSCCFDLLALAKLPAGAGYLRRVKNVREQNQQNFASMASLVKII
jgi:hypothetical protein